MCSRLPGFEPGLSAANVAAALAVLRHYGYTGPLALSCDDTNLEPALSIFQQSKDAYMIVGGIGDPIKVMKKDDLDEVFERAQSVKGSKVSVISAYLCDSPNCIQLRLWLLTIPLPKIPPIVIAVMARSGSEDAEVLSNWHSELLDLLHQHDIHPVSIAADGTEIEQSAHNAPSFLPYSIPSSHTNCTIMLKIPLYHGQYPYIAVQDGKHGIKTGRNQLLTGACILVLGCFIAHFSQLLTLVQHPTCPLFSRDVKNVDKQDDQAASHLFAAETLEFQCETNPDQQGLSTYFILGELGDAWQNQAISHLECARMVIRAHYFLMAWWSHITAHPYYSMNVQFISQESFNIFLTLCDSLLAFIVIYRKYYPTYPLLPWLHLTEPDEHVFGILHLLKKDFNFADMLYLMPKLRALLMGTFADLTPDEQANQTAAGYHHTYFHADDLDLKTLMEYPSDEQLADVSEWAYEEAKMLLSGLGIDATEMLSKYSPPVSNSSRKFGAPNRQPQPPTTLAQLLTLHDSLVFRSPRDKIHYETDTLALIAESVQSTLEM